MHIEIVNIESMGINHFQLYTTWTNPNHNHQSGRNDWSFWCGNGWTKMWRDKVEIVCGWTKE